MKYFSVLSFLLIFSCTQKQNTNLISSTSILDSVNFSSLDCNKIHTLSEENKTNPFDYYPDSILFDYMNEKFHQLADTLVFSNKELNLVRCGWRFNYKGSHYYEIDECNEWGTIIRIKIKGIDKKELIKLVNKCPRDNYHWYNDSTEYRPEKYYERVWTFTILKSKEGNILEIVASVV